MYITIGRNPQSDIVITGYDVVSYDHATIEYENGSFLFIDDSSNGTLVNGHRINHASCPVQQGDKIMLAGACMLDWNQVLSKIPVMGNMNSTAYGDNGRPTMPHVQHPAYQQPQYQQPIYQQSMGGQPQNAPYQQQNSFMNGAIDENVRKRFYEREINNWNWGAFLLSWIWGIFNNVYWTLVALIPIPFVGLIVSIIAGVKGTRQSWENGKWQDADIDAFKKKQRGWMIAGFIVLGIYILLPIIFWSTIMNIIASLA